MPPRLRHAVEKVSYSRLGKTRCSHTISARDLESCNPLGADLRVAGIDTAGVATYRVHVSGTFIEEALWPMY